MEKAKISKRTSCLLISVQSACFAWGEHICLTRCKVWLAPTVRFPKEHYLSPQALLLWRSPKTFLSPVPIACSNLGALSTKRFARRRRTNFGEQPCSQGLSWPRWHLHTYSQSPWQLWKKNANSLLRNVSLTPLKVCCSGIRNVAQTAPCTTASDSQWCVLAHGFAHRLSCWMTFLFPSVINSNFWVD